MLRYFLSLFFLGLFFSCNLPPALYVVNTPLGFSCSTDYNPNASNPENAATWSNSCPNSATTWLRFSVFNNKPDISGYLFYRDTGGNTNYSFFADLVKVHIVNDIITPNPTNIINFIADDTCSSNDPSGQDRGQTFPSIYLTYPTKYSTLGYTIKGLDNVANRQTSVIIPPLPCLGTGTFVVTTVDYINYAESSASNIITLTP